MLVCFLGGTGRFIDIITLDIHPAIIIDIHPAVLLDIILTVYIRCRKDLEDSQAVHRSFLFLYTQVDLLDKVGLLGNPLSIFHVLGLQNSTKSSMEYSYSTSTTLNNSSSFLLYEYLVP